MPTPATVSSGDARIDRRTTVPAALTELGIVYGDLGTSPGRSEHVLVNSYQVVCHIRARVSLLPYPAFLT
jgi:hypothetical protein